MEYIRIAVSSCCGQSHTRLLLVKPYGYYDMAECEPVTKHRAEQIRSALVDFQAHA